MDVGALRERPLPAQGADGDDAAHHPMGARHLERQAQSVRAVQPMRAQGGDVDAPGLGRERGRVVAVSSAQWGSKAKVPARILIYHRATESLLCLEVDESVTYKFYRWMASRPKRKPAHLRKPHPGDLIKVIRALADQQRVAYTRHALDRMGRRGFDAVDVEYLLTRGMIEGGIAPAKRAGEWECLVVDKLELEGRDAGVALVVVRRDRLIVKTVKWIDP